MATKSTGKSTTPKAIKEPMGKAALVNHIAGDTGLTGKEVKAVLQSLENAVLGSMSKRGAGQFTLPGLFKVTATKVPAKPKRKGIDPFTKEERVFAAKPATVKVKVRPLKKLKDAAA